MPNAPSAKSPLSTESGIFAVRSISSGSTCVMRKVSSFGRYSSQRACCSGDSSGGSSSEKSGLPTKRPAMKLRPVNCSRASSIRSRPLKSCATTSPLRCSSLYEGPLLQLLKSGGEVAQGRGLIGQGEPVNPLGPVVQLDDRFGDIGDLHVRIDPTRDGQPNHLEFRMDRSTGCRIPLAEPPPADFDSADSVLPIQCDGQ